MRAASSLSRANMISVPHAGACESVNHGTLRTTWTHITFDGRDQLTGVQLDYFGSVVEIDTQIGRLRQEIARQLGDDTMLWITSDNVE